MFRNAILIAVWLTIVDSSARASLWRQDAPVGESYEKVESSRRVTHIEFAVRARPTDRKHLLRAYEYNPSTPVARKNDAALQELLNGDAKKAVEMLLVAESENPGSFFTAANLGTAYELAGDDESALRWILEGIKRNPPTHIHTEWLHARILETKLKLKEDPAWLDTHTITQADFVRLDEPGYKLGTRQRPVNAEELRRTLWSQLSMRTLFVKPKDVIVAQLLLEMALMEAEAGLYEQALDYLKLADAYGLPRARMPAGRLGWEIKVASTRLRQQFGSVMLLIFPAIALYLLWKAWKMLARD